MIRQTKAEQARQQGQRPQDIPNPPAKPPTETQISLSVRKRAEKLGMLITRVNSGTISINGRYVQLAAPGTADLLGLVSVLTAIGRIGVFLACEVKRPGNVPAAKQQEYLDRINAGGGIGLWATSADDFEHRLRAELSKRGWILIEPVKHRKKVPA